jgi:hypothetical protein
MQYNEALATHIHGNEALVHDYFVKLLGLTVESAAVLARHTGLE